MALFKFQEIGSKDVIINGLYEQMMEDMKSKDWSKSVELMRKHLDQSTEAYKQLDNIIEYDDYPLNIAGRGYIELIQVMLDNRLPINEGYLSSVTMLHEAATYREYKLVKFLIERGADVNVKEMFGWTPLHNAAREGHDNIVQLLVENGADINTTDNRGNTPLHIAAKYGRESVVQYLVNKGCDTTVTDKVGKTAADLAETEAIKKIIQKI